ncbi:MAG: tyrosine-type recombinase/integrase [bacterium]|nr:tyrosine-type recombinase/integrase [bacterium]
MNAEEEAADHWMVGGALPCDEALRGWLKTHASEMSPSTEETHRGSIEGHLVKFFRDRDLRALTRDDMRRFVEDRFEAGKSAATIRNALSALRRVYSLHIEAGLVERNPAARCGDMVRRIGRRYEGQGVREVDAWTREEVSVLLGIAKKREPYVYPVLLAAICTGMRRGELLALRWEHVQPDGIRVRDALVHGTIKTPKTDKARTVPLSPEVKALLDELRKSRRDREGLWSEPGYVFTTATGGRWDEKNFGRAFRRLKTRCVDDDGETLIRPLSFHCCRHTFASWALEGGKSIVWLQHALGHASPDTTLRRYSHWIKPEQEDMGFLRIEVVQHG